MKPATSLVMRPVDSWPNLRSVARRAEEMGYEGLWCPEGSGFDAFTVCSAIATETNTVAIGTGIVSAFSRSSRVLAQSAASLNEISGARFRLGLGSGSPGSQRVVPEPVGHSVVERVADVIRETRIALAGLTAPFASASLDVPVFLAALGPRTIGLAGAVADGVILNWVTPELVAAARKRLAASAAQAGRDPSEIRLVAYVRVGSGSTMGTRTALSAELNRFASLPAYVRYFRSLGLDPTLPNDPRWESFIIRGTSREISSAFERLRTAGLDEVAVRPIASPDQWLDIVEAAAPTAH